MAPTSRDEEARFSSRSRMEPGRAGRAKQALVCLCFYNGGTSSICHDYPTVRGGLVQHLYKTYQSRTGTDLTARVLSKENRQGQLRADINALRTARQPGGGGGRGQ